MHLEFNLIYRPNPSIFSKNINNLSSSTENKKYNNLVLVNAFSLEKYFALLRVLSVDLIQLIPVNLVDCMSPSF